MNFAKVLALLLATAPATVADAPWFVLTSDTVTGTGFRRCGGVLVHPDIMITAGECADNRSVLRVGYQSDTDSAVVAYPEITVNRPQLWKRNGRFQEHLPNDLVVVKLNETITDIEPIKLDNRTMKLAQDNTQPLYYAHAGRTSDFWDVPKDGYPRSNPAKPYRMGSFRDDGNYYTTLQEGMVFTEEFYHCRKEYVDLPGYQSKLDETVQFCANANTTSPCDSSAWGSPLYADNDGVKYLVGLASQGQCTPGSIPQVYTRIEYYNEYISEQICALSDVSHPNTDCSMFDYN